MPLKSTAPRYRANPVVPVATNPAFQHEGMLPLLRVWHWR